MERRCSAVEINSYSEPSLYFFIQICNSNEFQFRKDRSALISTFEFHLIYTQLSVLLKPFLPYDNNHVMISRVDLNRYRKC